MRTSKLLGYTSRSLIIVGVLLLAFVAYQLWGTGIQHSLAQDSLEDDFGELVAEFDDLSGVGTDNNADADRTTGEEIDEELDSDEVDKPVYISEVDQRGDFAQDTRFEITDSVVETLPLLYRDIGDAIATINIDAIGLDKVLVEGTDLQSLKKGPGHYFSSPFPGQPGNASIAGHRITYGSPFGDIDQLKEGDEIVVTTIQGTFTYSVINIGPEGETHKIVSPSAIDELAYKGGNHLTLTSCHPRYSLAQRIIVRAELQGDPAVPLPRPEQIMQSSPDSSSLSDQEASTLPAVESVQSFGTGLNGDFAALPSFLLWALAVAGILIASYLWAKRWKRWRAYSISVLPFLFAVFTLFYYLDRLLPS